MSANVPKVLPVLLRLSSSICFSAVTINKMAPDIISSEADALIISRPLFILLVKKAIAVITPPMTTINPAKIPAAARALLVSFMLLRTRMHTVKDAKAQAKPLKASPIDFHLRLPARFSKAPVILLKGDARVSRSLSVLIRTKIPKNFSAKSKILERVTSSVPKMNSLIDNATSLPFSKAFFTRSPDLSQKFTNFSRAVSLNIVQSQEITLSLR